MMPSIGLTFASPTPVASFISSLSAVAVIVFLYVVLRPFRGRRHEQRTWLDGLIEAARNADHAIVRTGSWVTGTRHQYPLARRVIVVSVFTTFALVAALLPWPWGLLVVTMGVLAIFVVFRHWSRDEDEAVAETKLEDKDIMIRGDLSFEVTVACGFILVFAPIAFAQIAEAGFGFEVKPDAGPFGFFFFALIELVKAGSLVDYYDLLSDQLPFDRMSDVKHSGAWAKGAVLSYRLAISVLLLAVLKRLIDIARRRAEGADLRHIEELLEEKGADIHGLVQQLQSFALKGRGNALLLLERILTPAKSDAWNFSPDVRFAASYALQEYGERRGGTSAIYAAIAGYRRIVADDLSPAKEPEVWAMTQHNLGVALEGLAVREGSRARREEAIAAYRAALQVSTRQAMSEQWAMTQHSLANALATLGEDEGNPASLEEAIAAHHAVLEVRTRQAMPAQWATTMHTIGDALRRLGEYEGNPARLAESIAAFRAALEVRTREAAPAEWASTMGSLATAIQAIGDLKGDPAILQEAIETYRAALQIYTREAIPADWASTQHNLGMCLHRLGDLKGDPSILQEAVDAYRAALEVRTREAAPAEWASTQQNLTTAQNSLHIALQRRGDSGGSVTRLQQTIADCRATLEVRDIIPADRASTLHTLGDALQHLGNLEGNPARLKEATTAYRAALQVITREAMPVAWASIQNNLGLALQRLGDLEASSARLQEAIAAFRAALIVRTREAMSAARAETQHNLGLALQNLSYHLNDPWPLEEAIAAYREVLATVGIRDAMPLWGSTQHNLGIALETLGEHEGNPARLREAITVYRAALKIRTGEARAKTENSLARALKLLDQLLRS